MVQDLNHHLLSLLDVLFCGSGAQVGDPKQPRRVWPAGDLQLLEGIVRTWEVLLSYRFPLSAFPPNVVEIFVLETLLRLLLPLSNKVHDIYRCIIVNRYVHRS